MAERYIKYVTVQKLTAAGLKRVGPHVEADCAHFCGWYLRMQSSVSNESLFVFSACSKVWLRTEDSTSQKFSSMFRGSHDF